MSREPAEDVPERTGVDRWLSSRYRLLYPVIAAGIVLYVVRSIYQLIDIEHEPGIIDTFNGYLDAARVFGDRDPYEFWLSIQRVNPLSFQGFEYTPLFGVLMWPFTLMPVGVSARLWLIGVHLSVFLTGWVTWRVIRPMVSSQAALLLLAATLYFLPLYQVLYFLELDMLITLLVAVAIMAMLEERQVAAGFVLGFGTLLKLTPLAMVPALVLSRRDIRRPLGVLTMVAVIAIGAAGMFLATPRMYEWVTVVLPQLVHGTPAFDNFSLGAVLQRIFRGDPIASRVSLGIALVMALTSWLVSLGATGGRQRAAVLATFVALTPIVSSITWSYHLVGELLVWALLAPSLRPGTRPWWLAVAAFPLVSVNERFYGFLLNVFGITNLDGVHFPEFIAITSIVTIGQLVLWLACLDVIWAQRSARSRPEERAPA